MRFLCVFGVAIPFLLPLLGLLPGCSDGDDSPLPAADSGIDVGDSGPKPEAATPEVGTDSDSAHDTQAPDVKDAAESGGIDSGLIVPPGLPNHFGLGLKVGPVDSAYWGIPSLAWAVDTGVPWDYRYQYLNQGWESWNSPPGAIAALYMSESDKNHFISVFDFYLIGQPNASTTQSPTFMHDYFVSFVLLLTHAGTFGKPVIIHSEPDTWSYFQQQGNSTDPSTIPVSVASSGFAEVAGFADNAAGFAQALVALRDKLAPKALLAIDNSPWAVNYDVKGTADPETSGKQVAVFYQKLGAKFDLFFFNTMDRTSGFCQYVSNAFGPPGTAAQCWWGSSPDGTATNDAFNNLRRYIAAIHQATGLPGMLWQTPSGNTLYDSCNNTANHYQDNRPQYFLQAGNEQHIVEYQQAGVIGVLFGSGQPGDTTYWDAAGDGITHPAPVNGNTQSAQYSDDDGGFLRTSAATYYSTE